MELLSRIEHEFVRVDGCGSFLDGAGAGDGGGEGFSVPHALQSRYVDGLISVQMSQVHVSSRGRGGKGGFGRVGSSVGGGGLLDGGMGGFGPADLDLLPDDEVPFSGSIWMGRPWLPHGFSLLGGM